jgi:hypothetical protein
MTGPHAWPRQARLALLLAMILALLGFVASLPPLPQPESYHRFADGRACLGMPNCLDVVSNAALLAVGLAGAIWMWRRGGDRVAGPEMTHYRVFFFAIVLTGIGSAYYHWAPDHGRLVWDRLPMSLAFMALLSASIAERLGPRAGRLAFAPLLLLGLASVLAWHVSELRGEGDLRPYLFMQGGAALAILLLPALFRSRYSHGGDFLRVLLLYGLALLLGEALDRHIYALGGMVSGHTLKHLVAGLAVLAVLRMLRRRTRLGTQAVSTRMDGRTE